MIKINSNYRQLESLEDYDKKETANPNYYRISSELRFLSSLSNSLSGKYDLLVSGAAKALADDIAEKGCTTKDAVEKAEKTLSSLAAEARSFEYLCVAHAHIDMNWQWGYHETVSVTLATMETMLDMLEEYPAFIFSQSQASVYRIVEKYAPEMFGRIKKRVDEGRWEVLASTWVETDKNMPSGESLTRHILYTKKYFTEKFGIKGEDLDIDFEPDTFGHNRNVPEICASGGVKYYYHCRGHIGDKIAYRWRSPSGAELLVYTEPFWYNSGVDSTIAEYAPEVSRLTASKTLLKLYGVGDHGGGPTRRDINRFIEMNSWPLYPKFTFGRLKDYFLALEKSRDRFSVLDDEINFVFDGCYTTQTRIKAGNRKSERLMADAEFFAASAVSLAGREYPSELLAKAWRKILFNQFHDIIPGSGVTETREYASGLYQEIFAVAESVRTLALEAVAARINRAKIASVKEPGTMGQNPEPCVAESRGEGAGAGYGQSGRNSGLRRFYHVFNSLPYDRDETVSITVWDYEGDIKQTGLTDCSGLVLPLQLGESGNYWGHHFDTVITRAVVPSNGYTTLILDKKIDYESKTEFANDGRVQSPDVFTLENEYVRVVLNSLDGSIASFVDKGTKTELAYPGGGFGVFRLAQEARNKGIGGDRMSAWAAGRFKSIETLGGGVEIKPAAGGKLRTAWYLKFSFGAAAGRNGYASILEAVVSLDSGSHLLRYDITCDWREFGSEDGIPNLHFRLPLNGVSSYLFDLAFGVKERKAIDMDLPGESFVLAKNENAAVSLALFSMDKYAYRCLEDSLSLTLIRGAIQPDPTPETGRHKISFAISPIANAKPNTMTTEALIRESLVYRRAMTVISGKNKPGKIQDLEPQGSFLKLKGGVLSAVKKAEPPKTGTRCKDRLVFRIYEAEGKAVQSELTLAYPAVSAFLSDALEEKRLGDCKISSEGRLITFTLPAYSVRTLIVELM